MFLFLFLLLLSACTPTADKAASDTEPTDTQPDTEGCEVVRYADEDGDGYGDPDAPLDGCEDPGAGSPYGTDCDDEDAAVRPGATETCDEVDQDCDDAIDEGVGDTFYTDVDGDGYGDDDLPVQACEAGDALAAEGGDCDDRDADIHPDADEVCDEEDQDCDDAIDEGVTTTYYPDTDYDGYGDDDSAEEACAAPDDDWIEVGGDCDDSTAATYPDAEDHCDGEDNDCDSTVDEDHKADWILVSVQNDGSYEIDPSTGAMTLLASLDDQTLAVTSLDVSEAGTAIIHDNSLYQVMEIDVCDGTTSSIGETGFEKMGGIAFTNAGLIGLDQNSDVLVSIDTTTGEGTEIGSLGMDVGNNGVAYDCATDTLYGLEAGGRLLELDVSTGTATVVANTGTSFSVVGLEYDASTQSLLATDGSTLYRITPSTGAISTLATLTEVSVNDLGLHPTCP